MTTSRPEICILLRRSVYTQQSTDFSAYAMGTLSTAEKAVYGNLPVSEY
jgi:hypothetical protein